MGYAEIKEKYASAYQTNKSSSSRSSSSESRGSERSSSSSASSTSNSICDTKTEKEKTYIEKVQEILNKCNDSTEVDAATAINNMAKSSLFEGENVKCYYDRMVRAAEKLVNNEKWRISMDTDGDGTIESVALADAVAASFDSELDLYIQDIVSEIMDKYGTCSKSYLGEKARKELAARGIRVDSVGDGTEEDGSITNRVYSFSLVELPENADEMTIDELYAAVYSDDAKIVEDANGKKANYLFADCLIPDGCAQGAEVHLSSILDQMGYDCISKADFIGREDEYMALMGEIENYIQSGAARGTTTIDQLYGNTKEIGLSIKNLWGGSGSAPGQYGIGGTETLTESERLLAEKEEEQDISEYRKELLEKAIDEYKQENNGEEPDSIEMQNIENKVDMQVKSKFGNKI